MRNTIALLAALGAAALAVPAVAAEPVTLRYHPHLGQVAVYRLTLRAEGEQSSLGERRPVRLEAELELREQATATSPAQAFWLRTRARLLKAKDPSGVLAAAARNGPPEMDLHVTSRGEVLASRIPHQDSYGPLGRAFGSLMAQPGGLVVLPEGPVREGASWQWQQDRARQATRLVSFLNGPSGLIARLSSTCASPLSLAEESEGLGLSTRLSGTETQVSGLDILVDKGVVVHNKGQLLVTTNGEIALDLPEGVRRFPVSSRMRIAFDLRLVGMEAEVTHAE